MTQVAGISEDEPAAPPRPRGSGSRLVMLLVAGAVVGKGLGFVREIMMAQVFGASLVADAFRAATTGIMMPLAPFQSESVPATLIPLHRRWQEDMSAPRLFAALSIAITCVGILLMTLVIVFGRQWIDLLVGGFSAAAKDRTYGFLEILALAMPASVLLNVLAACEISLGRSRMMTLRAGLTNVSIIIGLVGLMIFGWEESIAWAFAAAFNTLALAGLALLIREGALDFTSVGLADIGYAVRAFGRQFLPLTLVPLTEQANIWIERLLASTLLVGTLASLEYARTITDSAVLFISQPIGLVLLSRFDSRNEHDKIQAVMRPLLAVGMPGCVALALFAPDIARVVFARGAFNEIAVGMTADAIRGISVGLWAATVGWVVLRLLNGAGRNMAAAAILVAAYLANLAFNSLVFGLVPHALHSSLILGLGEAVRGLVLFGATVVTLKLVRPAATMITLALVPAAVMFVFGWVILDTMPSLWPRLCAAGLLTGLSVALGLQMLSPHLLNLGIKSCFRLIGRWSARR